MVRALLGISVVLAFVAGLDAVRGNHWDQFAMLLILVVLIMAAIALETRRRVAILLRPDLVAWVEEHAARTDDDSRRVVDRAVVAYRAEMLPDIGDESDGS